MALISGTRLGPYEILAPIGAGGMGEVYKANDTRLDRTVAIKVLPEHLAESPERKARFEREAKAISQLNHPHICTLYDVGEQDGIDFIVMEYIEGETLADRISRGPIPLTYSGRRARARRKERVELPIRSARDSGGRSLGEPRGVVLYKIPIMQLRNHSRATTKSPLPQGEIQTNALGEIGDHALRAIVAPCDAGSSLQDRIGRSALRVRPDESTLIESEVQQGLSRVLEARTQPNDCAFVKTDRMSLFRRDESALEAHIDKRA